MGKGLSDILELMNEISDRTQGLIEVLSIGQAKTALELAKTEMPTNTLDLRLLQVETIKQRARSTINDLGEIYRELQKI